VDHPARLDPELAVQPWQRATLLFAVIAVLELVLLIVAGGALLAKSHTAARTTAKAAPAATSTATRHRSTTAAAAATPKPAVRPKATPAAELPRGKVKLVVLNGNGRQGAAADAAAKVQRRGYHVGIVGNAPRQDYPQTIVMYRRGFEGEGQRLAKDLGVQVVGPLDGMTTAQLHGAQAVLILGG
jgi:hypothetical protein